MIKIEATRNNGKIVNLTVKGHANSAPKGEDLVCSAVSAILVGGCNALNQPNCFAIKLDSGDASISENSHANEHDYEVLETMMIQFKTIEESYGKFLQIIEKGN
jgi:uncharacterized protein YsxB (DUF464 family)